MKVKKKMSRLFEFLFRCLVGIAIIIFIVHLAGCSCNYHIKRAQKKCGLTSKTDTVIVYKPVKIAGQSKDTSFASNKEYERLESVLDSVFNVLNLYADSNFVLDQKNQTLQYLLGYKEKEKLKSIIIGAAKQNNCIKDTLVISLQYNGNVKIWQTKEGEIKFSLREPDREISVKVPVAVTTNEFKQSFISGVKWVFACLLLALALLVTYRFLRPRK